MGQNQETWNMGGIYFVLLLTAALSVKHLTTALISKVFFFYSGVF